MDGDVIYWKLGKLEEELVWTVGGGARTKTSGLLVPKPAPVFPAGGATGKRHGEFRAEEGECGNRMGQKEGNKLITLA